MTKWDLNIFKHYKVRFKHDREGNNFSSQPSELHPIGNMNLH